MEFPAWHAMSEQAKAQQLRSWIQELDELNKNIANQPDQYYNNARRRKVLKNNLRDATRYMRFGYNQAKEKKETTK